MPGEGGYTRSHTRWVLVVAPSPNRASFIVVPLPSPEAGRFAAEQGNAVAASEPRALLGAGIRTDPSESLVPAS